jgi:hypothetical protein
MIVTAFLCPRMSADGAQFYYTQREILTRFSQTRLGVLADKVYQPLIDSRVDCGRRFGSVPGCGAARDDKTVQDWLAQPGRRIKLPFIPAKIVNEAND